VLVGHDRLVGGPRAGRAQHGILENLDARDTAAKPFPQYPPAGAGRMRHIERRPSGWPRRPCRIRCWRHPTSAADQSDAFVESEHVKAQRGRKSSFPPAWSLFGRTRTKTCSYSGGAQATPLRVRSSPVLVGWRGRRGLRKGRTLLVVGAGGGRDSFEDSRGQSTHGLPWPFRISYTTSKFLESGSRRACSARCSLGWGGWNEW